MVIGIMHKLSLIGNSEAAATGRLSEHMSRMRSNRDAFSSYVDGKEIAISGIFPRVAKLRAEYHEYVEEPVGFVRQLKNSSVHADLFTFLSPVSDAKPRYDYPFDWHRVAVLHFETYQKWWKEQINDKTRNMVRKAGKKGVTIQVAEFDDEFARGIHAIYNESPIIQGKPSRHYGKDFETLKQAHMTFPDRSVFIAARLDGMLIGFIKMIMHKEYASLMQINSLMAQRDKAPTNALLAKAVEVCEERGIHLLQYGVWSRRSLGAFKKHHGFVMQQIPRYFVPISWRGRVALGLGLHRNLLEFMPGNWLDTFVNLRTRWYTFKYRSQMQSQGL